MMMEALLLYIGEGGAGGKGRDHQPTQQKDRFPLRGIESEQDIKSTSGT